MCERTLVKEEQLIFGMITIVVAISLKMLKKKCIF